MDCRPRILVVDDEEMVTASVRAFFDLEGELEVVACNCPRAALDMLADGGFDVVIADYLMPHMNGVEFLKSARGLDPCVPRVLLTGYSDKDAAIAAINEAGLHFYLEKPWCNGALEDVVRGALAQRRHLCRLRMFLEQLGGHDGALAQLGRRVLRGFA